jgi:hypothetical protein
MARTHEQTQAAAAADRAIGKQPQPDGVHKGAGLRPGSSRPTPAERAQRQEEFRLAKLKADNGEVK